LAKPQRITGLLLASVDKGKLPIHRGYILTEEDHLRRRTIMRLMCDLELDYAHMSELLGLDFKSKYAQELDSLKDMEEDGLIQKNPIRV
jgi:oxygen-independent coproporphyrinogen-3 oxidase